MMMMMMFVCVVFQTSFDKRMWRSLINTISFKVTFFSSFNLFYLWMNLCSLHKIIHSTNMDSIRGRMLMQQKYFRWRRKEKKIQLKSRFYRYRCIMKSAGSLLKFLFFFFLKYRLLSQGECVFDYLFKDKHRSRKIDETISSGSNKQTNHDVLT